MFERIRFLYIGRYAIALGILHRTKTRNERYALAGMR